MVLATPANTNNATTDVEVRLAGTPLAPPLKAALEEVTIDEALHLPAMLTLRLHLADFDWLGPASPFVEGTAIEVAAREDQTRLPLFKGKIAGLEPDLSIEMPLLIIRAYDHAYALHRHHQRRAFLNVTDGDLVRQLASAVGLQVQVDDPGITYAYLFQNNVSHYDFLRERARRVGYDLYVDGDTLYFKRPHQPQPGPRLEYGTSLHRFRPRASTFEPVSKVTVRGWDPKAKREIVGQASSPGGLPQIGQTQTGVQLATTAWGGGPTSEYVVTDRTVTAQTEADRLAQSYLDELGGSHLAAEGLANGDARLRLLRQIEIAGVGGRFSGKYTLTAVTHTYTNRGHQTSFTASARRVHSVGELLGGTRPQPDLYGPVVGLVTNINDPEKRGRVKVKFPWLAPDQESHWARIASPLSGKARGAHFLPEVDDEVLVAFEHGDINHPYILGGLWNGKDDPPVPPALPGGRTEQLLKGGGGAVQNRLIKSTKGNMLIFNDSDGAPGVFLLGSSGAYIMVDDENGKEKIVLADKTRNNRIEIRSLDKAIELRCEGEVIVNTKSNLKATVQGTADIQATGAVALKSSSSLSIEATGPLSLKGATVTVEGQGLTEVKGATVRVQGSGVVAVSGATVTLG